METRISSYYEPAHIFKKGLANFIPLLIERYVINESQNPFSLRYEDVAFVVRLLRKSCKCIHDLRIIYIWSNSSQEFFNSAEFRSKVDFESFLTSYIDSNKAYLFLWKIITDLRKAHRKNLSKSLIKLGN